MSNQLLTACWPLQMPAIAKAVLISLADRASDNQGGTCYPSTDDICARTCLKRRTVQKAIRWLIDHGAIRQQARQRANGSDRSNLYEVTPGQFRVDGRDLSGDAAAHVVRESAHHVRAEGAPRAPLEPKGNPMEPIPPIAPKGAAPTTKPKGRQLAMTMREFLQRARELEQAPIPPGSAPMVYAEQAGIPYEILLLHWNEFKARGLENGKRYKDWRAALTNSLRDNWYGLWTFGPAGCVLTSRGRQAEHVQRIKAAADAQA